MTDSPPIGERLAAIEARLAALETPPSPPAPTDDETFWALHGLKARTATPGAVLFVGAVDTPLGSVEWQFGQPTERLLNDEWTTLAGPLVALGHPVRLAILRAVLSGTTASTELAQAEGMGTTGQLYHHLHQLTAHGWLVASARGRYVIPPERIVPLLAIIAAARR